MRLLLTLTLALFTYFTLQPSPPTPNSPPPAAPAPLTGQLSIAAAADLRFVMEDLTRAFNRTHPDVTLKPTFSASGTLFAQISNGAKFDLFLSADLSYPQKLADANLTAAPVFTYAQGTVVLWTRNESNLKDLTPSALLSPDVKRIAIANPATAPYGRSAKAALESLSLYTQLQPKLILAENVAQSAQFAESGNTDAAFISLSLALSKPMKDKGRFAPLPPTSYPPLYQGGVLLKSSPNPNAAQAFATFLQSQEAQNILHNQGLSAPNAEPLKDAK